MDSVVDRARAELAALDQQEKELRSRIEARRAELRAFLKTASTLATATPSTPPSAEAADAPGHGSKQVTVIRAVREILEEAAPQTTRALLAELEKRGIRVSGTDAAKQVIHLSSMLSRNKYTFKNDRATGWSLKKLDPSGVGASLGSLTNSAGEHPDLQG